MHMSDYGGTKPTKAMKKAGKAMHEEMHGKPAKKSRKGKGKRK